MQYLTGMMGWLGKEYRLSLARRIVAWVALVSFTIGNVGWPQAPAKPAAGARGGRFVTLSETAGCCCGPQRQKSACGCCKRPAATKVAGCCQKKQPASEKSNAPAVTCGCGDSSFPGFIVSTQPKLGTATIAVPRLVETFAVSAIWSLARPQGALAPDTPPPRTSVS